jgi:ATP-dependent DNA helicase RecG
MVFYIIKLGLKSGEINICVGTHALFSENIEFKSIGISVIDEFSRFGVLQREILFKKGSLHLLLMSATPMYLFK